MKSYDQRQAEAPLLRCVRCECERYVTVPREPYICPDCQQAAAGLAAVYGKYRHLDKPIRDEQWADTLRGAMLRECWIAICAVVKAP